MCEAWAQQMFTDGFFNADPHPGNLLVRNEPGLGPLPVLLDFGLCKRLANPNPNPNPNANRNPNPNPTPYPSPGGWRRWS